MLWIFLGVNADPYQYLATDPDPGQNYYGSGLRSFKWIQIHNTATFLYLTSYKTVQSGSAVINQLIGTALLGTAWIMTNLNRLLVAALVALSPD